MKGIVIAVLLAAVQLEAGSAVAQDTRSAIEKALRPSPSKTTVFLAPDAGRLLGETWRAGVFAILEARLARARIGRPAPKNAVHICLDIDDRGRVMSASICRSSGSAEADKSAILAAAQGGAFPPPPGGLASIKLVWVHRFEGATTP